MATMADPPYSTWYRMDGDKVHNKCASAWNSIMPVCLFVDLINAAIYILRSKLENVLISRKQIKNFHHFIFTWLFVVKIQKCGSV